jgi:hypothetical protein
MAEDKPSTEGVNRCEWCLEPAPENASVCSACGGPVRAVEPCFLDCGWCGKSNRRDETAVCKSCGGPLPIIPGAGPGPRPPDPPRPIPKGYRTRIMLWKNFHTILGIIFTVVLVWSLVFPVAGIILWVYGARKAKRILKAIEQGPAARGRLLEVAKGETRKIGRRRPWKITIEYETTGGIRLAEMEAWDPSHEQRVPGERLWVVYLPETPEVYALWPPIH